MIDHILIDYMAHALSILHKSK